MIDNSFIQIVVFFISIGLVLGIISSFFNRQNDAEFKKEINLKLNSLPDFEPTQKIISVKLKSGVAIDEKRNRICLFTINKVSENITILLQIFQYKDILSVELFKNNISITKTVRSSQIGSVVAGGLLLGGAGVVIGGLTGKTKTTGKVNNIALRLIVNDTKKPLHDIIFLNGDVSEIFYKQQLQLARHWHGIIEVIIKRANEEEKNSQVIKQEKPTIVSQYSIADEIKKLADLHSSGFLTLEEFQQQKAKLLDIVDIPKPKEPAQIKPDTKICSKCNIPMQVKIVTKGEQQGKQFYVCSNYPTCREVYKFET